MNVTTIPYNFICTYCMYIHSYICMYVHTYVSTVHLPQALRSSMITVHVYHLQMTVYGGMLLVTSRPILYSRFLFWMEAEVRYEANIIVHMCVCACVGVFVLCSIPRPCLIHLNVIRCNPPNLSLSK